MLKEALGAVEVVTFDYPCELGYLMVITFVYKVFNVMKWNEFFL